MRTGIALFFVASTLALIGCAGPADRAATPRAEAASAQSENKEVTATARRPRNPDDIRCVSTPKPGSRIPERICMTEAAWERQRQESQDAARDWQGPKVSMPEP